jgi:hypothetical protein
MDYKWVRLTLKKNNNTASPANGNGSDVNQVCWDGEKQIILPLTYGPECNRNGSIIGVNVTDGGTGYTVAPTVVLSAPPTGGAQASAHANMVEITGQHVASIAVNNSGTGYTTAPTVTLTGGDGTGATAHVCVLLSECAQPFAANDGAPVTSVTLGGAGTRCYATAPAVSFTGTGTGAAATATLASTNSCIQSVTYSGTCNPHKGETATLGFSGGSTGSSGFSADVLFGGEHGEITAVSIQSSGNGYTSAPTTITGVSNCNGLTFTVNLGKRVSSLALTAGGGGYVSVPTVGFTTGTGVTQTDPTATATLGTIVSWAGQVTSVIVDNPGVGYTLVGGAPTVTFSSLTGSGAVATASLGADGGTTYYKVGSVTMDDQGYGYTTDPTVSFVANGSGSGALGDATLGRGMKYGKVYLITAMAETRNGARSFIQAEMATPLSGFGVSGALVVDGPNPIMGNMPNSNNFYVHGEDLNSCNDTAGEENHPAIGAYDDPNASPATHSMTDLVAMANINPAPDHYTGVDGTSTTPSVKNVFNSLGETMGTVAGLKAAIDAVNARKTNTGNEISFGSPGAPAINYIDGDATINGNGFGYGILVVTGNLVMSGNFNWYGTVLVIGDGVFGFSGGGTGRIQGMLLVAKIWDSYTTKNLLATQGSPTFNWNGGGNSGIYADHCWSTNMLSKIPFDTPPSTLPLKVLSTRTLP